MFTPDSRYVNQPTYTVALPDGTQVTAVVPPPPNPVPLVGYYQRIGQERLDLVAVQYLNAPTGFWRLCDANNSMVAGALAARALIGIPQGARRERHRPAGRRRARRCPTRSTTRSSSWRSRRARTSPARCCCGCR